MAPVPRVLGWGSLTPSREARRDCVDGGSGPPHPGLFPLPLGSSHTEQGRPCWDSSVLEISGLKCPHPLSTAWGRGGRRPPMAGIDAPSASARSAGPVGKGHQTCLISVNLNFPQPTPGADPRPRVGGEVDKRGPRCSPWGTREGWTAPGRVRAGAPWWMNLGVAGVRGR